MKNRASVVVASILLATLGLTVGQQSPAQEPTPDAGKLRVDADVLVLHLLDQRMQPMVHVDVGGGEMRAFIVDTGASVNVLDSGIAEGQGYAVTGATEIGAPGGPKVAADIVSVPSLQVGAATISDAGFVIMDLAGFSDGQIHGILGASLFRDYLLTFDLRDRRLFVSSDNLSADQAGVISYRPAGGQIEIDVDVAETTVATHIDTGAPGGFTLPAELIDSLPLLDTPRTGAKARLVGGERDVTLAQLDGTIRFAGLVHQDPNVAFMDPSPGFGNIGVGVLEHYRLSIDQENRLVRFQRQSKKSDVSTRQSPRRLGVRFRGVPGGTVLTVAGFDSNSLGQQAGLRAGDVLVAINGRPTGEYSMADLRTLFGGAEPLLLEIERDGAARSVEIP